MNVSEEGLRRLIFLKGIVLRASSFEQVPGQQSVDRANALLLLDFAVQGLFDLILTEKGSPTSYPDPPSAYFTNGGC